MSNPTNQVVVAFDFTASSRPALFRAIDLAGRAPTNILHFVFVLEPHTSVPFLPREGQADYEYASRVQSLLTDEIARELRSVSGAVQFFVHVRIGKPAAQILGLAREIGADLIVLGTKGLTGVEHLVLGSVAEKVVRESGCSIEIARPKTYGHVDLMKVVEVEPHHHYVPPHRYSYENRQVQLRPKDWPLY